MGRKRSKKHPKVEIQYPPLTTRKWIPPDERKKRKKPKPPPYPPQLTQKLAVSTLLKVWHDYKIINDCAVLLGDISMYHPRFSYVTNGHQGHAICIVCALYSKLCPSYHWCSKTIDEIVIVGDRFFQKSIRFQKKDVNKIGLEQLSKDVFIHSHKITVCLKGEKYQGLIFKDLEANNPSESKDYLANIIKTFFECHVVGMLSTGNTPKRYFTIWKFRNGYFLFDPTDHDEMCWPVKKALLGKGHTFVVRFPTTDRLVQVLQRQLPPTNIEFELIPINIERIVYLNTRYPMCILPGTEGMDPSTIQAIANLGLGLEEKKCLEPSKPVDPKMTQEAYTEDEDDADQDAPAEAALDDDDDEEDELEEEEHEDEDGEEGAAVKPKGLKFKKKVFVEKPRVESVTYFNYIVPDRIGIMLAETHQENPEFDTCFSLKDFCMDLGAIVHLRENKAKYWTSRILTNAIRLGYRICVESLMQIEPDRNLKLKDLTKKIELNGKFYTPVVEQYGAIGRLQSQDNGILDLLPALREVFSEHDTVILDGPLIVAVWKQEDLYYMFDSHERDPNGFAIVKEIQVGSVMEAVDFISGVACLTWFKDLRDLVDMYMANVDRDKRFETFVISKVNINDYLDLPEDWNNFKAICPEKWILFASMAQSDLRFPKDTRNSQCTANCLVALAYHHLTKVDEWTTAILDEILDLGDTYYKQCIDSLEKKGKLISPMLLVSELITDFVLKDSLICITVLECLVNGVITVPEEYRSTWNLKKGLLEFFRDNNFGILTCRGISVAVFKSSQAYFYFDSHDRNDFGYYMIHGRACIQRFMDLDKMADVIMANLGPDVKMAVYNINRVDIRTYKPIPYGEQPDEDDSTLASGVDDESDEEPLISKLVVERPLYNYTKLTKKRAILRAGTHQLREDIFNVAAGKQTFGNLLAAPSMARVLEPAQWTMDVLDNVLKAGMDIYNTSIQEFYKQKAKEETGEGLEDEEESDDINLTNIIRDFKIGVNKFIVEFDTIAEDIITSDGTPLIESIKAFFSEEQREDDDCKELILKTKFLDVVMWKKETLYYLFDPKPRDERGLVYGKQDWHSPYHMTYDEDEEEEYDERWVPFGEEPEEPENQEIRNMIEKEWKTYGFNSGEGAVEPPPVPQDWEAVANELGKACVLWFTKPKYLIRHILANCPGFSRDEDDFILTRMILRNVPDLKDVYDPAMGPKPDEIAGDWNEWKEITHGQWILRGSMHQRNALFPETNRGLQSHANCLLALAFAYIYSMAQFKKSTVDEILKYGDRLYTSTKKIRRKELEELRDLQLTLEEIEEVIAREVYTIDNLIKTFCVGHESVAIKIEEATITGEIHAQDVEEEFDVVRGLQAFFASGGNKLGMLTSKNQTVAVFRMGVFYYMFDPEERGPHGITVQNGVACITRFQDVGPIAELYLQNVPKCGKNFFEIFQIIVGAAPCNKPSKLELRKIEDPLKVEGFEPVVPGKMIIRGEICQEDQMFGRGVNVQAAPIAIVALTMTLIHETEFWTKMIVDDVIYIGDEVYAKYIEKCDIPFNPWEDKLTIALSPKVFRIGKNKVNFETRPNDQFGIIDNKENKEPGVVTLLQGMIKFFEENAYGVLETDVLTVALWKEDTACPIEHIYMFDPNPRDKAGQVTDEDGVACVMKFLSVRVCHDHILELINDPSGRYLLTPIEIVIERDGKKVSKTKKFGLQPKIEPGVDSKRDKRLGRCSYYTLPSRIMSVLRGTKSQSHKCFSIHSRGRQDVANCIVAYVMDKLIPISRWTYKNIDMVLDLGDMLYKDSYMVYNPREAKIGLETLIRDVVIKDIRVKISVGAPVLTAQFTRRHLTEALVACFNLKNFCIVLIDKWAIAIFKKCETYFLFDPTDLDFQGCRVEKCGCAAVMRFEEINNLIEIFMRNMDARPMENEVFKIIIAAVKQIERIPVGAAFNDKKDSPEVIMPKRGEDENCEKILFGHLKVKKCY